MGKIRETLTLHKKQLMKWFHAAGGKEYLAIEKPSDTDKHKRLRLQWICEHYKKLTKYGVPVCFGDEKWFYTTNRRRKIKQLSLFPEEKEGDNAVLVPKMRNCRYPVKCIFFGIVANPQPEKEFTRCIFLNRVAKTKLAPKNSYHQRFCYNQNINAESTNDGWYELVQEGNVTCFELTEIIGTVYNLDDIVVQQLVFQYYTFVGEKRTPKYIEEDDEVVIHYGCLCCIDPNPAVPKI